MHFCSRIVRIVGLCAAVWWGGWAQEVTPRKMDLDIPVSDLPPTSRFLFVGDTSGTAFAVGEVLVDGEALWVKQSSSAPNRVQVVHWHFDSTAGVLRIAWNPATLTNRNRVSIRLLPIHRRKGGDRLQVWAGDAPVFDPAALEEITSKVMLRK